MDPIVYQTRQNLKHFYMTAPTPEARLLARQALTHMKAALHTPDQEGAYQRLSSLVNLFSSLSADIRGCEAQSQADECLDGTPGQSDQLSDYYARLGAELRKVEELLLRNQREPEPTLFVLDEAHFVGGQEEIWLALFRAVDLWKVKAEIYKNCWDRGKIRELHFEAFRWLDDAVTHASGPGIDPAYCLITIISRHILWQPIHSADLQVHQEQRVNLAITRLIVRVAMGQLKMAWLAEYSRKPFSRAGSF